MIQLGKYTNSLTRQMTALAFRKNELFGPSIRCLNKNSILFDKNKASFSLEYNKSNLPVIVNASYFQKFKEALGLQGNLRYPQPILVATSLRLYLCIQYQVDYDKFFKKFDMPDVMYSFCLVTFLHVWLVSVALMEFGYSGLFVRRLLTQNMWKDIEMREKKLKRPMNKKNKIYTYEHLNDIFRAFMFGFDEGLLSDDYVLAGAIWRHILEQRDIKDYSALGEMCDYIRKNVSHLEKISEEDVLRHGLVTFVDFEEAKLDHAKVRPKLLEVIRRKEDEP
jgi:cytochrome b pre-mRNA-processing protein 3